MLAGCATASTPAVTPPVGAPGAPYPGMMGGTPGPGGTIQGTPVPGYGGPGGMMQSTPGVGGPGGMMQRTPGVGGSGAPGTGGMMGGGIMGTGMMGSGLMMGGIMGGPYPSSSQPITMDQALGIMRNYQSSLNNPDLVPEEMMEFSQNFYVPFMEKSTGAFAFEVLVDRYTGTVYPEPGPNMMWNRKYSMMAQGIGTPYSGATSQMPINAAQAVGIANQFLSGFSPGSTVGEPDTFYGYYTIDFNLNGNTQGMLSVNGYTGDVWYHSWHGPFIQTKANP